MHRRLFSRLLPLLPACTALLLGALPCRASIGSFTASPAAFLPGQNVTLSWKHRFTRTYRPQTNGKAERFIQTITREWAYARSYASSDHRASFLPYYLHDYNFHRPHSALNSLPPSSRLPKTADNVSRRNS